MGKVRLFTSVLPSDGVPLYFITPQDLSDRQWQLPIGDDDATVSSASLLHSKTNMDNVDSLFESLPCLKINALFISKIGSLSKSFQKLCECHVIHHEKAYMHG